MMRTVLLSFKADVFDRLVTGEKIYEHRKVFPNDEIEAYLYVSAPVKSIKGIMHLKNKTDIETWKEKYASDKDAQIRINEYLKYHKYAMEIEDFQNTNAIPLSQLRNDIAGFVVPQMYYFIDGTYLLSYLKDNITPIGEKITHNFENITSDQICKV